jgi:hypothetical protein
VGAWSLIPHNKDQKKDAKIFFMMKEQYSSNCYLALPTACKAISVGSFEPLGTLNDAAFTLCNTWISNCVKNHESCEATQQRARLPRRVIDIGYTGQGVSSQP